MFLFLNAHFFLPLLLKLLMKTIPKIILQQWFLSGAILFSTYRNNFIFLLLRPVTDDIFFFSTFRHLVLPSSLRWRPFIYWNSKSLDVVRKDTTLFTVISPSFIDITTVIPFFSLHKVISEIQKEGKMTSFGWGQECFLMNFCIDSAVLGLLLH